MAANFLFALNEYRFWSFDNDLNAFSAVHFVERRFHLFDLIWWWLVDNNDDTDDHDDDDNNIVCFDFRI